MKKIIAIATALTVSVMVAGPGAAQAQTAADLQAQIQALLSQLNALQGQLSGLQGGTTGGGTVSGCSITSFARNLSQGSTGDDVKCLQVVLNSSSDTRVASTGAGSPGSETSYLGSLTKGAVVKFQNKYASEILTPLGLSAGTGFVGSATRTKLNTMLSSQTVPPPTPTPGPTTPPVPTGAGLTVALASDTPAAQNIVAGQSVANLARFTFTNGDSSEVKVTSLKLKRLGISIDTNLSNVYLFDGAQRLTDAASVSSGIINFNDTTGLFKVAAGSSKTITVKADIAASITATIAVGIDASSDVTTNASSVKGTFPMKGNEMSVISQTLATVDFNTTTTPSGASVDPQNDYTVWQNVVSVGTRAVDLNRFSLRKIGSVKTADLQNFRLYVDGVMVGSAVQSLDANDYVTFDLSSSPKRLETGSRTIKVLGDIIGGTSFNFQFSLRIAADANFVDSQLGATLLPTANSSTFSARTAGSQSVNAGTLTIQKTSDSPSGDVVNNAPNVTLARYEFRAAGERVKVETLTVEVVWTNSDADVAAVGTLRNGAIFKDGVQIGSTQSIDVDATSGDSSGTAFSLGSSLIVEPGTPSKVEVRADVFDNDGTNHIENNDTLQVRLLAGSSNAEALVSKTTLSVPGAATTGNATTVKEGALTLAKYTAYVDQVLVPPLTNSKLAHFTLGAGTTEAVNVSTITVDVDSVTDAFDGSSDLINLYVKYGDQTATTKATVADSANAWSINYSLGAGKTIDVIVYADVLSGATDGDATSDQVNVDVTIAGTTANSAVAANASETRGQLITFGTGSFNTAVDGSTPLAQVVSGSSSTDIAAGTPKQVAAGAFKITAANDTYTIKEVQVKVGSATIASAILKAVLKDGDSVLAERPFDQSSGTAALFTGLSVLVPSGTTKVLTVDLKLSTPNSEADSAGVNAAVTLDSVKHANSQGTEATDPNDRVGNTLHVYKSIPTVSNVDITNTALSTGVTKDLYKFKVAADSKGAVAIKQMEFGLTWADGTNNSTLELESWKLFRDGTDFTSLVTIQDQGGNSMESTSGTDESDTALVVTFDTEESIGAGQERTYILRATAQGFAATANIVGDDSVTIKPAEDTTHNSTSVFLNAGTSTTTIAKLFTSGTASASATNYNFIWSDNSATGSTGTVHSGTVGSSSDDWWNGTLVKNLATIESETWSGQ